MALIENGELKRGKIQASMDAIQTGVLIPKDDIRDSRNLGKIVLTSSGNWIEPDPESVFLGSENASSQISMVHPELQTNPETLEALKKLGFKPVSPESAFRNFVSTLPDYLQTKNWNSVCEDFWKLSRDLNPQKVVQTVRESNVDWYEMPIVRAMDGRWRTLSQTLLPGPILPEDGSRDAEITIDTHFHQDDLDLLRNWER